jgi:hypothetical protein
LVKVDLDTRYFIWMTRERHVQQPQNCILVCKACAQSINTDTYSQLNNLIHTVVGQSDAYN